MYHQSQTKTKPKSNRNPHSLKLGSIFSSAWILVTLAGDCQVLSPNPSLIRAFHHSQPFAPSVFQYRNAESWQSLDNHVFLYPIHPSGLTLVPKGLASILYYILVLWMNTVGWSILGRCTRFIFIHLYIFRYIFRYSDIHSDIHSDIRIFRYSDYSDYSDSYIHISIYIYIHISIYSNVSAVQMIHNL